MEVTITEDKEMIKQAQKQWQDIVANGKKYKEDKLLDLQNIKIEGDDDRTIKRRIRTLRKIKKNEYRRYTLKYLTKNTGRSPKKALKHIYVKDKDRNIKKTIYQCQDLEEKLIIQNIMHHKKVFNIKAFRDKIYKYLLMNNIRNRILDGKLRKEDYSNEDVCDFFDNTQKNKQ